MLKPVIRHQAQLPFRRSYKPGRTPVLRFRPRPARQAATHELHFSPACAPEGAWPDSLSV